jgi:prephenate dehydrogenase
MAPPTVLITSLGLMGGSLAAALSRAGWPVLLHHRRPEVAMQAEELGYGRQVTDLPSGLARADLCVVCTPVGIIADTVRALTELSPRPVFTDVGSVKGSVCAALADLGAAGRFVGSHPMAGSHLQGLAHAKANLYHDCLTVVTPLPGTPEAAIALVELLWQTVGSRVCRFPPDVHDDAVATASHLPHILAATAAAGLDQTSAPLAASGFRDTTRVAAGSPDLWADILLHNRKAVRKRLAADLVHLAALDEALAAGDAAALRAWLELGCEGRRRFEQHYPLDDQETEGQDEG